MNADNIRVIDSFAANRGESTNWDIAHPWIQSFADWTVHTRVWTVRMSYAGNPDGFEWNVLADSEYQAIQTAYKEWEKLPDSEKYPDFVD